ncbi:class I SAM-dependent methyltransferase [Enterovibrio sp. ZSDZ42]|uniref:Class I SAM-dependent methyltransferase n=1 Tax=Enterovibrio gelatinilyticus TaxID=2899819 RepID=A0ABT5QXW0_9GAMM|nr:class I SAM-dependent methyltransferase [Enterovibrio sp. ZSDZ42]MDD1792371.1 class I SAM-dependent methyltransferase [Enterovibrio sp. ZSDZ42]
MIDINEISRDIELGAEGIYFSQETEKVSFPDDGHHSYAKIEETSFWFKHRNECIVSAIQKYPPNHQGTIFDVGGGNGFVSLALKNSGFDVALIEPGIEGAVVAKRRGIDTVICATTDSAKILPNSLPAIGLFDVIEHVEDDHGFLTSINLLLQTEGSLYITVPAWDLLWSHEDVIAGHYRRYSLRQIEKKVTEAGFYIEYSTYFFRPLPLPIFAFRSLPYKVGMKSSLSKPNPKADHEVKEGLSSQIINSVLSPEVSNIKNGIKMMFGASCLLVAKKKN